MFARLLRPLFVASAGTASMWAAGGLFSVLGTKGAILTLLLLIFSLSVHEAAHAWVANLCGDSTAKDLGRMTVNPAVHIDPMMTIVVPLIMMMTVGFIFGGAKPVPVMFHRLRHPWRDMMLVAIAGPISNVLLAIAFAILRLILVRSGVLALDTTIEVVLHYTVLLNLILAIFNMIPLPPLDGSRVMAWLLPDSLRPQYVALERFGMLIVMLLVFTRVFGVIIGVTLGPALTTVNSIAEAVTSVLPFA